MDNIRSASSEIQRSEYSALIRSSIEAETAEERGLLVTIVGSLILLSFFVAGNVALNKAVLAREQSLLEAQNARDSLRTTLASIGDAVISTDLEGRVVFANDVALSLLGSRPADVLGKRLDEVFQIVNEFTRATVESPVNRVLREGTIIGIANHTVLISKNGQEIPIDDSAAPIRGEGATIHGTVLVFRDVTERRRAEETGRLLVSIVESSNEAIISEDLNGLIRSWNKGAERVFGYSAQEITGQPVSIIAAPGRDEEMSEILNRIKKGERIDRYETLRRTKSGKVINVALTAAPVYDALGRIVGASRVIRDITEQVQAAERLAKLNDDLQKVNQSLARSNEDLERFAFVASHDLQEPLRMITSYVQLLVKTYAGRFDEEASMFVNYIVEGTKRMRELLADLLAYTEIGAADEQPIGPVDLNRVLEKVKLNLKLAMDVKVAP